MTAMSSGGTGPDDATVLVPRVDAAAGPTPTSSGAAHAAAPPTAGQPGRSLVPPTPASAGAASSSGPDGYASLLPRPEEPPAPVPAAQATASAMPAPDMDSVTCPECGTRAGVTINRRESADFCQTCDFPLFWTPAAIVRDRANRTAEESLRRLPGQRGRASVASMPCPHCSELNAITAQVCVRCGLPMRIVAPAPVFELPPPPAPAPVVLPPEPEPGVSWWVWALLALGAALLIALVVLIATGKIH